MNSKVDSKERMPIWVYLFMTSLAVVPIIFILLFFRGDKEFLINDTIDSCWILWIIGNSIIVYTIIEYREKWYFCLSYAIWLLIISELLSLICGKISR